MIQRLFSLAAASLFFLGCSRTISEKEPNDHFTNATEVKANGKVQGALSSAGDVDVYKLDFSKDSGSLSLHLGGIRDVDFVIGIQDKDRQEIKKFDETGVGGDEQALDIGLTRGVYYIALSNKNPKAGNPTQPYLLQVKTESAAGREQEPNDKAIMTNELQPGGIVRGHYFPSQNLLAADNEKIEDDWYLVKVDKAGLYALNIDISEVPKIDPLLEIYDANAYKIKEIDGGGVGEPESVRHFGISGPAQFTLRLRAKNRAANSDVPYELLTELLPYDGKAEFEPNDQRPDATPFAQDMIRGSIASAGDVDWYKISVATDAKHILRADLSALPGMDLQLALTDELGKPLTAVDNMDKEQPEVLTGVVVGQGDYYLVVSEKTEKAADARHDYTLAKSLSPLLPGLEFELNDSSKTAQAVKVGDSLDGYVAPKGDVDWYEFNVYKKGLMTFEITGILNVRLAASLYDQDYAELETAAAKKSGDSIAFEKGLEAGTYWLKLRAEGPQENNVRDKYTLRLRMR